MRWDDFQGILAKSLAHVFNQHYIKMKYFSYQCVHSMLTNPCPMFKMYKSKLNLLTELVLLFIKFWLQGYCYRELTILFLCTLGQRYEQLLLEKSWPFFVNCDSSPPCLCMRKYPLPPPSRWLRRLYFHLGSVFMTVSPYYFSTYKGIEFCLL